MLVFKSCLVVKVCIKGQVLYYFSCVLKITRQLSRVNLWGPGVYIKVLGPAGFVNTSERK